MRTNIYLIILLISMVACNTKTKKGLDVTAESSIVSIKKIDPSLFEDLEGNPFKMSDYKGKKIVLNFWATYCIPCIKEMPSMVKAQEILEKENHVLLLASNESTEKVKKFISRKNFDLNFIKYTGSLAQQNIYALPATFIYNEKGEKVDEILGAVEWNSKEIIERIINIK